LESWTLALTAERKSPATIRLYTDGAGAFLRWRKSTKPSDGFVPDKSTAQAWVADLLANGAEPATAHARLKAVRRFTTRLAEEGEVKVDPLAGIGPVRVDTKVTRALSDDELKALLATCRGRSLRDCRDTALIRFMTETGARSVETVGLQVDDIDLKRGLAVIRRGKAAVGAWSRSRPKPWPPLTDTCGRVCHTGCTNCLHYGLARAARLLVTMA
jgi:integrase/recombinase XerD